MRGWSFGFICNKEDEEINDNGISERTVRDIDLFEVSIIDDRKIPAYIGTSIEMRDGEVKEIEFRYEETESDENTQSEDSVKNENFSSMTASQKRELLNGAYRQTSKQVKVVRGGYKEVRYEEKPEQQPKQEVEKIDFSEYENRIKKIKEETE